MVITAKIKEKLLVIFKGVDYRQIVSTRVGCHPNTVSNVLLNEHDNLKVATALLELAQELKPKKEDDEKMQSKARAIAKQL